MMKSHKSISCESKVEKNYSSLNFTRSQIGCLDPSSINM